MHNYLFLSIYKTEAFQLQEIALKAAKRHNNIQSEATCVSRIGDIALARSDHEAARKQYEQALPLYRQVGDVLGEANCIRSLGDIALARSDHEAARKQYEQALDLYKRIREPYSIGVAHYMLARVAQNEAEQREHVQASRAAWTSIGFDHMLARLDEEFGNEE